MPYNFKFYGRGRQLSIFLVKFVQICRCLGTPFDIIAYSVCKICRCSGVAIVIGHNFVLNFPNYVTPKKIYRRPKQLPILPVRKSTWEPRFGIRRSVLRLAHQTSFKQKTQVTANSHHSQRQINSCFQFPV